MPAHKVTLSTRTAAMPVKPGLARNAMLLTLAGGLEFGLQLAIPMIFVRFLEPAAFGQYRLLWLMAGTALAIGTAFMPQSLFYFLPRATHRQKRILIGNVLLYLGAVGCVVALLASAWNPLLPAAARSLFQHTQGLSALFLGCWMLVSVMTVLPTAEGRIGWQAGGDVGLSVLRTILLAGAAVLTREIAWVVAAMVVDALARLVMLLAYLATRRGGARLAWQRSTLQKQLAYALPFACGNALFMLRVQTDQWVVASMLPSALFATFSIAAVFLPVGSLIRQPIINALMPPLNLAYARGNLAEIARLIRQGSGASALLLVPVAGVLCALAPELVLIIYTGRYAAAVPVMQVYLIGMMLNAFAVGHLLPALAQGRFAAVNNACCLPLSVACSIAGASRWGLVGAALGSVLTLGIGELWSMTVVARTLGVGVRSLLPWRAIAVAGLSNAAAIGAVSLSKEVLSGPPLLLLVSKGLIFLVAYAACFVAAGGVAQLRLLRAARSSQDGFQADLVEAVAGKPSLVRGD